MSEFNFNTLTWFDTTIIFPVFLIFLLNLIIVNFWDKIIYRRLGVVSYKSIQRVHVKETPRLGGLTLYLGFILWALLCNTESTKEILFILCLTAIPFILITTKEDLFYNVKPTLRILALFVSGLVFFKLYKGPLPNLDNIFYFGKLFVNQNFLLALLLIGFISIANGMNLIDGVNGLCASAGTSMLLCLVYLSNLTHDLAILNITLGIILLLFPFFIFNYPRGKIFLGDTGAYFLGVLLATLTIIFFGRHPELPTLNAILILVYPVTEVIFTIHRRLFYSQTPIHKPDSKHLHLQLFKFLRQNYKLKKIANNLVMPLLAIIWIMPFILITVSYKKSVLITASTFFFVFIYFLAYNFVKKNLIKES